MVRVDGVGASCVLISSCRGVLPRSRCSGADHLTAVGREELLAQTKAFIDAEAVPGVRVEAVVREGQAAAEIADMAISMNADLLVIGTWTIRIRTPASRIGHGEGSAQGSLPRADCPATAS